MTSPTERGLFERLSDHVPLPNWPEVEDICEEFEQELAELKESDQLLTEIANILDDVGYKGTYADGVQLLKQQLAAAREEVEGLKCLLERVIQDDWQPDFILRKYNSDEMEENILRDDVLKALGYITAPLPEKNPEPFTINGKDPAEFFDDLENKPEKNGS